MARPVVGIIGNFLRINDQYPAHAGGTMVSEAVRKGAGALPVIVPADPALASPGELVERFDGFLLPGGRPNVHPQEYGETATEAHGTFDEGRDALALPLIRRLVERGQPLLGLCRGFQEVNVAFGGTLHPEIRDLPGRMNHRMPPEATTEEKFGPRHRVRLTEGGVFHRLFGTREVMTNTLHGQGVMTPASRVVIEGHAEDSTPEAMHVADAPGFALAVQWHAEYRASEDPVSRPLFAAFGEALRAWAGGTRPASRAASA